MFDRWRAESQVLSGFSFKTSQYGLTVDNIARFELVLPNGTITSVTSENEDLWFGLRVG
jgi:FAD/FMN-containing dehydrogenase